MLLEANDSFRYTNMAINSLLLLLLVDLIKPSWYTIGSTTGLIILLLCLPRLLRVRSR
jgi:hypothetical protein